MSRLVEPHFCKTEKVSIFIRKTTSLKKYQTENVRNAGIKVSFFVMINLLMNRVIIVILTVENTQ